MTQFSKDMAMHVMIEGYEQVRGHIFYSSLCPDTPLLSPPTENMNIIIDEMNKESLETAWF